MEIPSILPAEEIQDLEFIRISDEVRPGKWVEWNVRFTYEGHVCEGFLGGCPRHPYLEHDEEIQGIEKL